MDYSELKPIIEKYGKFFYEEKEISEEEARELVKTQLKIFESQIINNIFQNPSMKKDTLEEIASVLTNTKLAVANSGFSATELGDYPEYIDAGKSIQDAYFYSDRTLYNLEHYGINSKQKNDDKEIKGKKLTPWADRPDYEPTYREIFDQIFQLIFTELVYLECRNQLWNTGFNIAKENIFISGDSIIEDFKIKISFKGCLVSFNVNLNNLASEELFGKYIASGLKVGNISLQTNLKNYVKNVGHNLKTAQTLDNIIQKEIRFLKNTIKEEITYSLENNISSAEERLRLAKLYQKEYELLIDKITSIKLKKIIEKTEYVLKEKKEQKIFNQSVSAEQKNSVENAVFLAFDEQVKLIFSEVFRLKQEDLQINLKKSRETTLIDIQIQNQKVSLMLTKSEELSITSSNYLGSGSKDINLDSVSGNDLWQKIKNAALLAYRPVFERRLDSLAKNCKQSSTKKIVKILEKELLSIFDILNESKRQLLDDLVLLRNKIESFLDSLIKSPENIYDSYLEELDFIMKYLYEKLIIALTVEKKDEFMVMSGKKSLKEIFLNYRNEGSDLVESISEVRFSINRKLRCIVLICLLSYYVRPEGVSDEKRFVVMEGIDLNIKNIAGILSEDLIYGGISRKLLVLMNTSVSSRDDLFRKNLNDLIQLFLTADYGGKIA